MRDFARLEWLRTQPCQASLLPGAGPCYGPVEAHHNTHGRGMGQKVPDSATFSLCHQHHMAFHDAKGVFRHWNRATRREWQEASIRAQPSPGFLGDGTVVEECF